ncbi:nitrate- and nitrite sensing domain-containing protein [Streptomyces sp. NPDC059506]|uniref:sensor histidine kinase n=1 Tax=Streptomyces sp. NPDC059506 TaxID=3347751 RepID=UPI0036918C1D
MRRTQTGPAQRRDATQDTANAESGPRGNFTPPSRRTPPATASPAAAPVTPSEEAVSSGSRFALRNWRVPTRLMAILVIPVLTGLVFAGLRINSSVESAQAADEAARVAILTRDATVLSDALQNERDISAYPLTRGDTGNEQIAAARKETDEALAVFRASADDIENNARVTKRVRAAETALADLEALRRAAYKPQLSPNATQQAYSEMFRPLMMFANELNFGESDINSRGRGLYTISLTKASVSTTRALVSTAFGRGYLLSVDPSSILTAAKTKETAEGEFRAAASDEDLALYDQTVSAKDGAAAKEYMGRVIATPPGTSLNKAGLSYRTWYRLASAEMDQIAEVEFAVTEDILRQAEEIRSEAQRDAIVNAVAVLLALALAGVLTGLVARSMVQGMRTLRTSAMDIAETRLPELVSSLSRTDPGQVDTTVGPIPLFGRDEIGEVARAFDQVHREAVRLASEQALLRGNVNAIFTNLSRRNQGLIQRQLTLITDLENNEADPDQLENLFKLDHLATRMRRNGENLLVLAGEEPGRRWTQPVPLVDVLRAAASEVESYERIELFGIPETEIHGTAVNDLVHLLAELLENATTFSSPQTKVRVTATRLPDGRVMVEIHDKGIGLTAEDFADINHKLANPPTVDVAIAKRMGLFVVGRLSARHGIRVQLRPSGEQAGTTSLVMLPEPITHGGGAAEPEETDFQVSRIVPDKPVARHDAGMRTAAELGFDDGRYERPDTPALDPVGRSALREERRAALGAGPSDRPAEQQFHDGGPEAAQGGGQDYGPQPPYLDDAYTGEEPYTEQPYTEQGYDGQDYAGQDYQRQDYREAEYPSTGYGEDSQAEHPYAGNQFEATGYDGAAYGDDRYDQQQYGRDYGYAGGRPDGYPDSPEYAGPTGADSYAPEAESAPAPSYGAQDGVSFDGPGPSPDNSRSFDDAGLPRRERQWGRSDEGNGPDGGAAEDFPAAADRQRQSGEGGDEWLSTNDEHWQRASQVREPQAGGVTPSGLPRRVPKANLVPGTAQQTQQGGPQVSRAPEEVRGRLSNLRRGVQQGRNAGTDTNGQGFGPNHQER